MFNFKNYKIMKFVNDLVSKVGVDKVLHLLVSALITAWGGMFAFPGIIVSAIIAVAIGYFKEKADEVFDKEDFKFDLYGIGVGLGMWFISCIL